MSKLYYGSGECNIESTGAVGVQIHYRGAIKIKQTCSFDSFVLQTANNIILIYPLLRDTGSGHLHTPTFLNELFSYEGELKITSVVVSDSEGNAIPTTIKKVMDYSEFLGNAEDITTNSEDLNAGHIHKAKVQGGTQVIPAGDDHPHPYTEFDDHGCIIMWCPNASGVPYNCGEQWLEDSQTGMSHEAGGFCCPRRFVKPFTELSSNYNDYNIWYSQEAMEQQMEESGLEGPQISGVYINEFHLEPGDFLGAFTPRTYTGSENFDMDSGNDPYGGYRICGAKKWDCENPSFDPVTNEYNPGQGCTIRLYGQVLDPDAHPVEVQQTSSYLKPGDIPLFEVYNSSSMYASLEVSEYPGNQQYLEAYPPPDQLASTMAFTGWDYTGGATSSSQDDVAPVTHIPYLTAHSNELEDNYFTQIIDIRPGWNWISFNVAIPTDHSWSRMNLILNSYGPMDGDIIKHPWKGSAQYFQSYGYWTGGLTELEDGEAYQIYTSVGQPGWTLPPDDPASYDEEGNLMPYEYAPNQVVANIRAAGIPVDPDDSPITIGADPVTNFIPYVPQYTLPINVALREISGDDNGGWSGGGGNPPDVIRNMWASASHYSDEGTAHLGPFKNWQGSLKYLTPGVAYKITRKNATVLYYPSPPGRYPVQQLGAEKAHDPL